MSKSKLGVFEYFATGVLLASQGCLDVGSGDVPAEIALADGAAVEMGYYRISSTHDLTITLVHDGEKDATNVSIASPSAPFSFKGGNYPGTGGTCGSTISSTCTLVLQFAPTDAKTYEAVLSVKYTAAVDKTDKKSLIVSAVGVMGSCRDTTSEVDDFGGVADDECNATWVNETLSGDAVSTDSRTGLMWSRSSQAGDIVTEKDTFSDGYINWFEATGTLSSGGICDNSTHTDCNPDGESYCGALNTAVYGGFTDWQAPGQKELMQAYIDGSALFAGVFAASEWYWTKTTESDNAIWASYRGVYGYGGGSDYRKNLDWARGICIRATGGGSVSSIRSCATEDDVDDYELLTNESECDSTWTDTTVSGDVMSRDSRTGLVWSRPSEAGDLISENDGVSDGSINWFEATGTTTAGGGTCDNATHTDCNTDGESYCGILNAATYGGYTDWRAPGQKELAQAYINGGTHNASVFDSAHRYWGNTTESDSAIFGAFQRFGYGNGSFATKNSSAVSPTIVFFGICVRQDYEP